MATIPGRKNQRLSRLGLNQARVSITAGGPGAPRIDQLGALGCVRLRGEPLYWRGHEGGIARQRTRLDRASRLGVLLHDAPEYVIGDMISPFKAVIGDAYKAVESRLLAAIHLRFGLPAVLPGELVAVIKASDRCAASTQRV